MIENYGATTEEWDFFSKLAMKDLLPVVSNPKARISERSSLTAIGKTPSIYDGARNIVGIPKWTKKISTRANINSWKTEPDYGICLQTRKWRAYDIDVEDSDLVARIIENIQSIVGTELPIRFRENSNKCLLLFKMPGDFSKTVARLPNNQGMIEF